ncbi:MAG: gluconokinase [Planctomycetota bacterium]
MPNSSPSRACRYAAWVVMGVSGCGKSTVAEALADALGVVYADADDFHPTANVEKMRRGEPLTDADRWPWLDALSHWLADESPCVLACSALRQAYRDRLGQRQASLRFVHLAADYDTIRQRMESREHFMPATLLQSQFETLEPPTPADALILDATQTVDQLVAAAVADARR